MIGHWVCLTSFPPSVIRSYWKQCILRRRASRMNVPRGWSAAIRWTHYEPLGPMVLTQHIAIDLPTIRVIDEPWLNYEQPPPGSSGG